MPDATGMRVGIVVSEWNDKITSALLEGACQTLIKHGVKEENITVKTVPGSFELVYGSARFASSGLVDAVIAIGCVIRGDTPHFDYICQGVTQGLADLNREGKVPVIYGLLTCNTLEQAEQRSGGMLGNKGAECAKKKKKMVKGWE